MRALFKSQYKQPPNRIGKPFLADLSAGFYVFLLALPLSLGIAEASGFPAVMGLLTAGIGGVFTSWFTGSKLSIKGPAAGLIVIVLGAVNDLGGAENPNAWIWALGAIFVAGAVQILLGVLKLGKWVNVIPPSAIQGMLAAIGIVILSKQVYLLIGIPTQNADGERLLKPLDLLRNLPTNLKYVNPGVAAIGLYSIVVLWIWTRVENSRLKAIPSPLIVLLTVIPAAYFLGISAPYRLQFDFQISEILHFKIPLTAPVSWALFFKYVGLFAVIGSLESLLTVNALQGINPEEIPDKDKDLIAIGMGNMLASAFGGLPMISEVARSTANIHNGARTQWANVFHGLFVIVFVVFSTYFNGLIPMSALAAMLVMVGIKLASPRVLVALKKIGPEQIWGFSVTLVGSLALDLLWGLALGSLAKIIVERIRGSKQLD